MSNIAILPAWFMEMNSRLPSLRDPYQLRPPALGDGREIKNRPRRAMLGIKKVQPVIQHSGGEPALPVISRDQLHIDGAARVWNVDGAQNLAAFQIPHSDAAAKIHPARHRSLHKFQARSKSSTSVFSTPVSSTAFSALMAAPSPASSFVPFSFTLPRAT